MEQKCEPSKPTATAEIVNRLESMNGILREILGSQKHLLEKLHGPRPEQAMEAGKVSSSNVGMLSAIDDRLNWLLSTIKEINDNQDALSRLA